MPELRHDSLRLHHEAHGEGPPVLMLHGGVSSFAHNYAQFGWIEALTGAGRQVVGLDFRGHGRSDRPHEAVRYGTAALAGEALALLDHLRLRQVALVGYSIGAAVALELMRRVPARIERAVLVAAGDGLVGHGPYTFPRVLSQIAPVFEREAYPADLPKAHAAYWKILESSGADRHAMRALCGADYPPLAPDKAGAIDVPTLVISGERDHVLGCGSRLAAALGHGEYLEIAGANHFALAMDTEVRDAVAAFLRADGQA
jgi:pimeloyl-ACP methyl ester carboxylesterase